MKKGKKGIVFVFCLLTTLYCCQIKNTLAQSRLRKDGAVAAVRSFYQFHRSNSISFNRRGIEARKKWFSKELYLLFLNELKLEREYLKANPTDKPFFGDGFPFQPYEECFEGRKNYPNVLKIGTASVQNGKASVEAKFYAPQKCGGQLIDAYKIELLKVKGKWLIDDWIYSDDKRLSADLKSNHY